MQGYRAKTQPLVAAARVIVLSDGKSMSASEDEDGGHKTEGRFLEIQLLELAESMPAPRAAYSANCSWPSR